MSRTEFQFQAICDPRLAVHATSAHPVWLWSADGKHVLWANPVGVRLFCAANSAELSQKTFGPADVHRRQIAQLANRLPLSGATRLERLRGFGALPGMLMTCGCARLDFPDGSHGLLINAVETALRSMPLAERLQLLAEGLEMPIAAFDRDGTLVGASDAAGSLLDLFSQADLEQAHTDALVSGHVELSISIGNVVLQRVGSGADVGVVALIIPHAVEAEPEPAPADDAPQDVAPAAGNADPGLRAAGFGERSAGRVCADRRIRRAARYRAHDACYRHAQHRAAGSRAGTDRDHHDDRPDNRRTREAARRENPKTRRRRHRDVIRCASPGRWMPTAISRSAPTSSAG